MNLNKILKRYFADFSQKSTTTTTKMAPSFSSDFSVKLIFQGIVVFISLDKSIPMRL